MSNLIGGGLTRFILNANHSGLNSNNSSVDHRDGHVAFQAKLDKVKLCLEQLSAKLQKLFHTNSSMRSPANSDLLHRLEPNSPNLKLKIKAGFVDLRINTNNKTSKFKSKVSTVVTAVSPRRGAPSQESSRHLNKLPNAKTQSNQLGAANKNGKNINLSNASFFSGEYEKSNDNSGDRFVTAAAASACDSTMTDLMSCTSSDSTFSLDCRSQSVSDFSVEINQSPKSVDEIQQALIAGIDSGAGVFQFVSHGRFEDRGRRGQTICDVLKDYQMQLAKKETVILGDKNFQIVDVKNIDLDPDAHCFQVTVHQNGADIMIPFTEVSSKIEPKGQVKASNFEKAHTLLQRHTSFTKFGETPIISSRGGMDRSQGLALYCALHAHCASMRGQDKAITDIDVRAYGQKFYRALKDECEQQVFSTEKQSNAIVDEFIRNHLDTKKPKTSTDFEVKTNSEGSLASNPRPFLTSSTEKFGSVSSGNGLTDKSGSCSSVVKTDDEALSILEATSSQSWTLNSRNEVGDLLSQQSNLSSLERESSEWSLSRTIQDDLLPLANALTDANLMQLNRDTPQLELPVRNWIPTPKAIRKLPNESTMAQSQDPTPQIIKARCVPVAQDYNPNMQKKKYSAFSELVQLAHCSAGKPANTPIEQGMRSWSDADVVTLGREVMAKEGLILSDGSNAFHGLMNRANFKAPYHLDESYEIGDAQTQFIQRIIAKGQELPIPKSPDFGAVLLSATGANPNQLDQHQVTPIGMTFMPQFTPMDDPAHFYLGDGFRLRATESLFAVATPDQLNVTGVGNPLYQLLRSTLPLPEKQAILTGMLHWGLDPLVEPEIPFSKAIGQACNLHEQHDFMQFLKEVEAGQNTEVSTWRQLNTDLKKALETPGAQAVRPVLTQVLDKLIQLRLGTEFGGEAIILPRMPWTLLHQAIGRLPKIKDNTIVDRESVPVQKRVALLMSCGVRTLASCGVRTLVNQPQPCKALAAKMNPERSSIAQQTQAAKDFFKQNARDFYSVQGFDQSGFEDGTDDRGDPFGTYQQVYFSSKQDPMLIELGLSRGSSIAAEGQFKECLSANLAQYQAKSM